MEDIQAISSDFLMATELQVLERVTLNSDSYSCKCECSLSQVWKNDWVKRNRVCVSMNRLYHVWCLCL